ncbi:hypothetical protein HDU93_003517, partial [Gonapodya sp. JEL0774]
MSHNPKKRPAGNDGGETRNSKRKFHQNPYKPTKSFGVEPGWSGVLVTHTLNKEKFATRELFNLFNEAADEMYGEEVLGEESGAVETPELPEAQTEAGPKNDDSTRDVEEDFSKELADLQAANRNSRASKRRFASFPLGIHCILFIRTQAPVDPTALVHRVLTQAKETGVKKTRHCNRLSPLTLTCLASMKNIEEMAKAVLAPIFHTEDKTPLTYGIVLKMRDNDKFERFELIEKIASLVGSHHKVNLTNPQYSVIVE